MNDAQLSAALRRMGKEAVARPIDPAREEQLLAAFDEHFRSQRTPRIWHGGLTVGLLAIAATLVFAVTRPDHAPVARAPLVSHNPFAIAPSMLARALEPAVRIEPPALSGPAGARVEGPAPRPFVMWPGADALPTFESGQLMRMELPASMVLSLGLRPSRPLRNDGTIQTDVLVGQDGYARAVRLVQ